LASLIERSLGLPQSYRIVSARYDLLRVAQEEGIRVPPTKLINTLDDLRSWSQRQAMPWVLKADGTSAGKGVRIAQTPMEAEEKFLELTHPPGVVEIMKQLILHRDWAWVLAHTNRLKPTISVQSFIQGRPANCAAVCWEGRVLAGFAVEVVSSTGMTDPAIAVRVVDNPAMMLATQRLASRLGLSGFFGLDFMIEDGSGEAFLVEMNPRCTPLCHLQLGSGRDLVEALRAQLSDQPCRATPPVTQSDVIAYFPYARISTSGLSPSWFEDIPQNEPDLVEAILHPWSQRSVVGRLVDYTRQVMHRQRRSAGLCLRNSRGGTRFSREVLKGI
jgi:predicted ATP-grasp superfamily ATP-dependent carboligase